MSIYLLLSYIYIHSLIFILSEYAILSDEETELFDNTNTPVNYFESYQFDIFNENDCNKHKISSQKISSHKISSQKLAQDYDANKRDNNFDEVYYNYYINNIYGNKEISSNNQSLCIHSHNENGLKLALTNNANEEQCNMPEFNNDNHWHHVHIFDSLNKVAARGIFLYIYFRVDKCTRAFWWTF
eukprot:227762_1